jgi:hypothetical protein
MTQLYDLRPEYACLAELPLETTNLTDDPSELAKELEAIREELGPKLLSLAKVVRMLQAEAGLLEEHGRAPHGPGRQPTSAGRLPQALDAVADGGR